MIRYCVMPCGSKNGWNIAACLRLGDVSVEVSSLNEGDSAQGRVPCGAVVEGAAPLTSVKAQGCFPLPILRQTKENLSPGFIVFGRPGLT